jgi:uncharacterized protein with ParB-like and HNH nuclease domain
MAFQTPITIKEAVQYVHLNQYLLPAIQREFVWTTDKIEKLFDSVLQGYPINSFLFWEVKVENKNAYQFYKFIKDYKQDLGEHNERANIDMVTSNFTAVLDGQQRLTSFYIGLMGSYSERYYRARRGNLANYYIQYLYLNLSAYSEDEGKKYAFEFLEPEQAAIKTDTEHWFKVSDILQITDLKGIVNYITQNNLLTQNLPITILTELYETIHGKPLINFFLEKSEVLDKVLNIFIRINSGGMPLSYSDMLFSMAAAQWTKIDARQEIHDLYDKLRDLGFWGISKDWILKACLYLTNISDIKFNVDNFNNTNMTLIENDWPKIKNSLIRTVVLAKRFGYDYNNISSYNAFLPIAHYLHNYQLDDSFHESSHYSAKRTEIKKWLSIVTLKRAFGGNSDSVLSSFRKALVEKKDFDISALKEAVRSSPKNLSFSDEEIEDLLETSYGDKFVYPILNLIYGNPDFETKAHLDHINPGNSVEYKHPYNTIINLQLLNAIENIEKQDVHFSEWLLKHFPSQQAQSEFKTRHFIPNCDLSVTNFDNFVNERKNILKDRLQIILQ